MRPAAGAVLVLVALAGCTDSPASPDRPVVEPSHWAIDVLADLDGHSLALYGFRADAPGDVVLRSGHELSGGKDHEMTCVVSHLQREAPVDAMRAWAAGQDGGAMPPESPAAQVELSVSFGSYPNAEAGGQDVATPMEGGFGLSHGESVQTISLRQGEWLLVAVGFAGTSPDLLDPGSSWDLEVAFAGPMTFERLPPAPLACGFGFRDLEGIEAQAGGAAFLGIQRGGGLQFTSPYGAYAMVGSLDATMVGAGEATLSLGDATYDLQQDGDRFPVTDYGPTEVRLDVATWAGYDRFWLLTGMWVPGVPLAG